MVIADMRLICIQMNQYMLRGVRGTFSLGQSLISLLRGTSLEYTGLVGTS